MTSLVSGLREQEYLYAHQPGHEKLTLILREAAATIERLCLDVARAEAFISAENLGAYQHEVECARETLS